MDSRDILVRPIVTEKTNQLMAEGRYTFRVALGANKVQIKKAVEEIFKVKVAAVNTARMHGKFRRQGKTSGYQPDWKKAVVTLRPGEKIQFFEGV
ncbi:MAG: 50S ribosomal protein L23 [Thermaerobacter sp.]|jgi:large subunit ribosomal protein L23|nr:50S ribosomal protein L23 [Thermaerobacter sp.]MDA8146065.1 50S ribosomal protein L23 [Thermaerobacter sp.]